MSTEFSMKELYDTKLKLTYPIDVGGRRMNTGEIVAAFDKIQIANFNEVKKFVTANGGFDNRARVIWQTTQQLNLTFTQGIFSKTQYALMSNSRLLTKEAQSVELTEREILNPDEEGHFVIKHQPKMPVFVYDDQFNPISARFNKVNGTVDPKYTSIIVDYVFDYENVAVEMQVGAPLLKGFLELEGRTRVKDDITGNVRTGIIKIPRLKVMSSLSMRLGENAVPVVGNFQCIGFPVGARGDSTVMEFIYLQDDIDSDL